MDRVQELLQYMHQLTHLVDEPLIDVTKRLERVCNAIECELEINPKSVGDLKVTIDGKEAAEMIRKEIREFERRSGRIK